MKMTHANFLASLVLSATLIGCAHEVKKPSVPNVEPVVFSTSSTPTSELQAQKSLTDEALVNQVDVLAPIHFDEANRFFATAVNENNKGASAEQVLKSLSFARAHLSKATELAGALKPTVEEVTSAREQALKGGARSFPSKLKPLDQTFKEVLAASKGNPSSVQKTDLQNSYLALELSSIKTVKLIRTKELLAKVVAKGAEKTTPKAYAEAISKFNIADKLIETDRHNNVKIDAAVATATTAATRVMSLLTSEQTSRNQTPEERAMTLEARDNALLQADSDISAVAADSLKKSAALAEQGQALSAVQTENDLLAKKEADDKVVADAAAKFSDSEAEVYRQDGLLIIRLKSMNFASGRSDLPAESMAVLTKVKEVIKTVGGGSVTVQGHTDAVGEATTNQKLSQNRAQAVAKFFSVDGNLENSTFDSIGYGYTKPLASNKTKEGRAQNRRVDVVIKTNSQI